MSRSRIKLLGFEQLEDRYLLSAAIASAPRSSVLTAPSLAAGQQASSPAGDGQFNGQRTISYIDGSLHAGQARALSTLQVLQDQDFHFVLTAAQWSVPSQTGVQMLILDASGQPVFTMSAAAGDTSAEEDYLDAGSYSVQFTRDSAVPAGLLRFDLGGITLPLADTTQDAAESSSKSTQDALSFYWLPPTPLPAGLLVQQPSAPSESGFQPADDAAVAALLRFMTGPDLQGVSAAEMPASAPPGAQVTALPVAGFTVSEAKAVDRPEAASALGFVGSKLAPVPAGEDRPAAGESRAAVDFAASRPLPPHASAGDAVLIDIVSHAHATAALEPAPLQPAVPQAHITADSSQSAQRSDSWRAWFESAAQYAADFSPAIGIALGWYALQFHAWRLRQKGKDSADDQFSVVDFLAPRSQRMPRGQTGIGRASYLPSPRYSGERRGTRYSGSG